MAAATPLTFPMGAATREAFGKTLAKLGHENPNIMAVDADLSKSTMTAYFRKEFPERFVEVGIAESNMVAIAAGLASSGKIPFASSFSCFILNKGFEQLRVTAAFNKVNVKIVGTHSGISIGEDGPSQMSIEDLSLACSLAGFVVLAPSDEFAMSALVRAAAEYVGPVFIRAGRAKTAIIYNADTKFEIGKAIQHGDGTDATIVANGLLVAEALKAQDALRVEGVNIRVLDFNTIKPLDHEALAKAAKETGAIVVAEEHLVDAGLGVRAAQAISLSHPVPMEFIGINDLYAESGTPEQLLEKYGFVSPNLIASVKKVLTRKR